MMSTPGALTSGLRPPLRTSGPRLEKEAMASSSSTAPTVSASLADPGELTVEASGPLLPAAMTNSVSEPSESSLTAWDRGFVPSSASPPRLMLTTSAPWATAQAMPASTPESSP